MISISTKLAPLSAKLRWGLQGAAPASTAASLAKRISLHCFAVSRITLTGTVSAILTTSTMSCFTSFQMPCFAIEILITMSNSCPVFHVSCFIRFYLVNDVQVEPITVQTFTFGKAILNPMRRHTNCCKLMFRAPHDKESENHLMPPGIRRVWSIKLLILFINSPQLHTVQYVIDREISTPGHRPGSGDLITWIPWFHLFNKIPGRNSSPKIHSLQQSISAQCRPSPSMNVMPRTLWFPWSGPENLCV